MGLTDQRAYIRGHRGAPLRGAREAHRWHARSPSLPGGQGGSPAPDTHQAKKTKTGQGASKHGRQQDTTPRPGPGSSHIAPPHARTPGEHQQHRPHQRPPPPPYRSTLTPQPSQPPPPAHVHTMPGPPYAQSQGTWHHQQHHHAPVPPNAYPMMPQYYSNPHQLHPHHAPSQPDPTNHPPHTAHITARHHHIYHHHQPLPPHPPTPGYHTQPGHPQHHHHAVQHHAPPPIHGPTAHAPRYSPMDPRGAAHAHQQHQGLVGAPRHHQQHPTHTPYQRAPFTCSHALHTDHSPTQTPVRPPPTHTSVPQPARDRKDRRAHTSNTHTTHRDAQTPSQHNTH